jgi:hypothetical protein
MNLEVCKYKKLVLIAFFSEYTYNVYVSRSLWSEDSNKCVLTGVGELPVLAVYLVEPQNRCIEQMRLFEMLVSTRK